MYQFGADATYYQPVFFIRNYFLRPVDKSTA